MIEINIIMKIMMKKTMIKIKKKENQDQIVDLIVRKNKSKKIFSIFVFIILN